MIGFGESTATILLTLGATVVLLAYLLRLELRRAPRAAAMPVRLAVISLAVLALVALALRPGWWSTKGPSEIWLLTPGATPSELSPGRSTPVMSLLPEGRAAELLPAARSIPDAAYVARQYPDLLRIHVLGAGLPAWDWEQLPGEVKWLQAPPAVPGIPRIWWRRNLALGDDLTVLGSLQGFDGPVRVTLRGPGGLEDEAELRPGDPLTLTARPRESGRLIYEVAVLQTDGTALATERLGVEVRESRPLSVLWLESAPSFEARHFKRWLTARGDALLVRSGISRDRFRFEFHNRPERQLARIDGGALDEFDLTVLDGAVLDDLPSAEVRGLRRAVAGGMGLLLRPRGVGSSPIAQALVRLPVDATGTLEEMSVRAAWPGSGSDVTPLTVPAREIRPQRVARPLVRDVTGAMLAASRPQGGGVAAVTLIDDTFRWVLEGNPNLHAGYWSHLIRSIVRRDGGRGRWEFAPGPVKRDQPLHLTLVTTASGPEADMLRPDGTSDPLAMEQDTLESHRFHVTSWPGEAGWHRVRSGEAVAWFLVDDEGTWTAWEHARREDATRARAALGPESRAGAGSGRGGPGSPGPSELEPARGTGAPRVAAGRRGPRSFYPLPRAPLFALFVAAMAWLWVGERRGLRTARTSGD